MRWSTNGNERRVFGAAAALLLSAAVIWPLVIRAGWSAEAPGGAPSASALHVPEGVSVREDDRAAILQWDFDPEDPVGDLPENVAGYLVTWGPADRPSAASKLTDQRLIQLQPLENGRQYVATVRSVDSYGRRSLPSAPVSFTGDPSRVEALRGRMNGFFDDFNLPMGAVDERKWNTAYSRCNNPAFDAFFINDQFHGHNTISSRDCDRGQQVNRPRAALDFSDNQPRTIVFDFDGIHSRNSWYIDLMPNLIDISGPSFFPPGGLRFAQHGQTIEVQRFGATGEPVTVATNDWDPYPPLDYAGLALIPNVRRQWEIRVSRSAAEIFIDGTKVLATPPGAFQLTQSRYHVHWVTFSYNTKKANLPFALSHWDNFGFDAPAGAAAVVTHNYKLVNSGSDAIDIFRWNETSPATVSLNIPDAIAGARERRLMFTFQMSGTSDYKWTAGDRVAVNGVSFPIPQPVSPVNPAEPLNQLITPIRPYTVVMPLPAGVLRQGANTLTFDTEASTIQNIHVELDFDPAQAPPYTQPSAVASGPPMQPLPPVGPNAVITHIGGQEVDPYADGVTDAAHFSPVVSGIVPIAVRAGNSIALEATGNNTGIQQIELLIDRNVFLTQRTDAETPAPAVDHVFHLDTRHLPDGIHEIYVRAYNPACVASIPEIGDARGQSGFYAPLHIRVQNRGKASETQALDTELPYSYAMPIVFTGGVLPATCIPAAKSQPTHSH